MSGTGASVLIGRLERGDIAEVRAMLQQRPSGPRSRNSIGLARFDAAIVQQDAKDTRIVVHGRYPQLVRDFLEHKRQHGSSVEKAFYGADGWDWRQQVARLVAKRPLMFMNSDDTTVLRDGTDIGSAAQQWDLVGTELESRNQHLKLADYLSYDEIMLGSLLVVSSPSHFINDGDRFNQGADGAAGSFEPRGIIMGLVGARFERRDRMDSIYIQAPVANPRQHRDLIRIFRNFFIADGGAAASGPAAKRARTSFDEDMFKARMRVSIDIMLLEANARAREAGKKAYLYVVGLGLGVWAVHHNQTDWYVQSFAEALHDLGDQLDSLGTLEFGYVDPPAGSRTAVRAAAKSLSANAIFSRRNPAAKLSGEAADQLLVLTYAWDGNSFPGNEYWAGSLAASGDPAAACMSQISELHNPVINPGFLDRIRVLGAGEDENDSSTGEGQSGSRRLNIQVDIGRDGGITVTHD